jgi:uncharacterized membrane protein YqjE
MTVAQTGEPTVGELLGSLATTTASLVKQEVRLASTEMAQKTSVAAGAVASVAIGGLALQMGLLILAGAVVVGLAALVPMWISAAFLGGAFSVLGAVLLSKGVASLKHIEPLPMETLKTLKDVPCGRRSKCDE